MEEMVLLNITILNRQYKIKVAPQNESFVLEKVQEIQQKINEFKKTFAGRDAQDYLAMTIIDFITSEQNNETGELNNTQILKKLENINAIFDA